MRPSAREDGYRRTYERVLCPLPGLSQACGEIIAARRRRHIAAGRVRLFELALRALLQDDHATAAELVMPVLHGLHLAARRLGRVDDADPRLRLAGRRERELHRLVRAVEEDEERAVGEAIAAFVELV